MSDALRSSRRSWRRRRRAERRRSCWRRSAASSPSARASSTSASRARCWPRPSRRPRRRRRHGLGLGRPRRRHRRGGHGEPPARLRVRHASRQPGRVGHGAQHHAVGAHGGARLRVVSRGRPDAAPRPRRPLRPPSSFRARAPSRTCPALGPIYREVVNGHNVLVYHRRRGRSGGGLDRVPHALRPAPARGRREPGRGRHGRHLRRRHAIPRARR
mgnify:CR=1 FL=1